ncbi:MAG: hypothetical protein R3D67_21060 [Hyphomicrobiaceae bacterium]
MTSDPQLLCAILLIVLITVAMQAACVAAYVLYSLVVGDRAMPIIITTGAALGSIGTGFCICTVGGPSSGSILLLLGAAESGHTGVVQSNAKAAHQLHKKQADAMIAIGFLFFASVLVMTEWFIQVSSSEVRIDLCVRARPATIVVTRNGKTTVYTGWRAWLIYGHFALAGMARSGARCHHACRRSRDHRPPAALADTSSGGDRCPHIGPYAETNAMMHSAGDYSWFWCRSVGDVDNRRPHRLAVLAHLREGGYRS